MTSTVNVSMRTRRTEQEMNIICPTGGVTPAMVRLVTRTMPKCTGSMPNLVTTGTKIGVRMMSAAVPSTAVPSTISRTLISSSSSHGFVGQRDQPGRHLRRQPLPGEVEAEGARRRRSAA